MHTNYAELSRRTLPGPLGVAVGFVSRVMNACLCAVHTHKVRAAMLQTMKQAAVSPARYGLEADGRPTRCGGQLWQPCADKAVHTHKVGRDQQA